MLINVLRETKNFFVRTEEEGEYFLENGEIEVDGYYLPGQFVAITGSILNDGIKRVESFEDGIISFNINPDEYPAWVAPVGTVGLYHTGDRVMHNGERWVSLIDNNSWEPGTVGTTNLWARIHDEPEEHMTTNEIFEGTIYGLAIPRDFIELVDAISYYNKHHKITNIISERFGVYSESRGTGRDGAPLSWEIVFRKPLNRYRKAFMDINI